MKVHDADSRTDVPVTPLSAAARQFLEALRASGRPPLEEAGLEQARLLFSASHERFRMSWHERVARTDLGVRCGDPARSVGCRLYRPTGSGTSARWVLFFHGGGWALGDLDSHDQICRQLAHESGLTVLSVDYRRAPEHPFPAAFDDGRAVLRAITATPSSWDLDGECVALIGDSAGGNIAAAVACAAGAGEPCPAGLVLFYPALDLTLGGPGHRRDGNDLLLRPATMRWFRDLYAPDEASWRDPRLSPAFASNLSSLPPVFLVTAGHDPLREEGHAWGHRLTAAGIDVTHLDLPGEIHGFLAFDGVMPAANSILGAAGAWLRRRLA